VLSDVPVFLRDDTWYRVALRFKIVQCGLDYSCADYSVCGLSLYDRELLKINDEVGK